MSCRLGFLYVKEAVLEALVHKTLPKEFGHITSLKDIVTLNVKPNDKKDAAYPFVCPISNVELNGINKFVFLWKCGCLFSEKAFDQIKSSQKVCPICNSDYANEDIVSLSYTEEQQHRMQRDIIKKAEEKKLEKKVIISCALKEYANP